MDPDRIAHNPETGEVFLKVPGRGWVPIDPRTLDVLNESGPEAFIRQAGQTMGGIVGGALELGEKATNAMGLTDSTQFADANRYTEAEQATRGLVSPTASAIGTGAGYAPDVLAGLATGGGSIAARGATAGAVEGTLGALRNPEDPLTGAAIQGGLGAGAAVAGPLIGAGAAAAGRKAAPAIDKGLMAMGMNPMASAGARRGASAAQEIARVSGADVALAEGKATINAAKVADGAIPYEGQRMFGHWIEAADADSLGIPLTRAQRGMLDVRVGQDDLLEGFRSMRMSDELRSSAPMGSLGGLVESATGVAGKNVRQTADAQRNWFTRHVAARLGNPNIESLNTASISDIGRDLSKGFEDILGVDNGPLPAGTLANDVAQVVESATGNAQAQAAKWGEEVLSKVDATGNFDRAAFSSVRAQISKAAESAMKNSNHELGSSLVNLVESMDEMLEKAIDDPAVAKSLTELRTQWRIKKVLERTGVLDTEGQINPRSFKTAYAAHTPAFKRNSRGPTEFEKIMETVDFLTTKPIGNSGTADRLLANRLPGLLGTAAAAGGLMGGQ